MDFKEINAVGNMYIQSVPTLLPWKQSDVRRLVYNASNGRVYYGGVSDWVEWPDTVDITNHVALTNPHLESLSTAELSAHIVLANPHTDSLSSEALSAHVLDVDNPHNVNLTLTDASSGAITEHMFAQEENCITQLMGSEKLSAGFINTYQLGQITYGLINSSVDDYIEWKKWERNVFNEIIGFEYERNITDVDQTLQYSMFGIVNRDIDTIDLSQNIYILWVTGLNNQGQLGLNDNDNRNVLIKTSDIQWNKIAGGGNHTMAIKTDGTLWATGDNLYGQLGLGDNDDRNTLTQVGVGTWESVSCGYNHTMAIKTDGTLWATGQNNKGQLGLNDNDDRNTLTQDLVVDYSLF